MMFDPIIEMMQSLKVTAAEGKATMTGTVQGTSAVGAFLPVFLGLGRSTMHTAPVQAAPPAVPVQPVP